jgi:hypothetical protein
MGVAPALFMEDKRFPLTGSGFSIATANAIELLIFHG